MAQLKSTNVTGNLSVTGDIIASTIKKFGGTSAQFLKADGTIDNNSYLTTSAASNSYQPKDEDLTKIAALTGTGFLKRKSDNTWEIGTETTYSAGTGLTLNGTTFNHSNSVTAVTTASLYKVKYDAQGHITGTTAITKADITGLGIPGSDNDTGATSVEVPSTGNALTNASYDAEARKITFTKGTFLTEHQSLADYVKGPASSTNNAIARYDGDTGKIIKNSGVTIDNSNNISTAGSISLSGSLKLSNNGDVMWNSGSWWQRIKITDDSEANTNVFEFQQSSDSGASYTSLFTIMDNGTAKATSFVENGTALSSKYQALDADLTAIAGLTGTSGFLKKTAANTWTLDTNTYTKSPTSTTTNTISLTGVDKTAHGNTAYYSDLTYVNSNTGHLTATSFGISTNATIKYESSDESIRFVFS